MKLKTVLDGVATALMLCASVAILWTVYKGSQVPRRPANVLVGPGDQFDRATDLPLSDIGQTLVLWLRPGCKYCKASMGFYREIMRRRPAARVLVAGVDAVEDLERYCRENDLKPDAMASSKELAAKLRVTPVLLLVEQDRRISSVWEGRLPVEKEGEVLLKLGVGNPLGR